MLLDNFKKTKNGNLLIMLDNGDPDLMKIFVDRVEHLCDNDPSEYKGNKINFEFSLDSHIRNIVIFDNIYTEFCRQNIKV